MSKVYILKHDYGHSGDSERDAFIVEMDRRAGLESELINTKIAQIQNKLRFQANLPILLNNDYPLTDLIVPIVSKKLESVLSGLGCDYALYPVIMFDDSYIGERFDNNGELKKEVPCTDAYSVLQLKKYHDFFDYDRSEYRLVRGVPRLIQRFVLKEPKGGFPSIFRISETPSDFFISEKTKEALESNGIKGCVFEEVETTPFIP